MSIEDTKRAIRRIRLIWRVSIITIISAALVPLFLANVHNGTFFFSTISASFLGFLLLALIFLSLKTGKIRDYVESTSNWLLLGFTGMTLAWLVLWKGSEPLGRVLVAVSAVLYAAFLQRLSFVKGGWL